MITRVQPGISPQQPMPMPVTRAKLRSSWGPLLAAMAIFVLLLVVWLFIGRWYEERLLVEQRAEVVSEVSAKGSALSSAVNRRLARLQGLHAFVLTEGSDPGFAAKFETFAADIYAGSRGIRSLAVAPDSEVRFIYPLDGNESVLGYKPLSDPRPEVPADVWRAIRTEQVILSGPIELVQGGLGLIARQAVFRDGSYWGLVNVVLDVQPLLSEAGVDGGSGALNYAIRDNRGRVFQGSSSVFANSPIITQILLPEGYWELAAGPPDGWSSMIRQPLSIYRIGSLISIILLTCLIYVAGSRQTRLSEAVELRTHELWAANLQLEQRVEERTLELTMLLNVSRSLASTLELEVLLEQALNKLSPVVDYTSAAIFILEGDTFTMWAHHGLFPKEFAQYTSYSPDNVIGHQLIEERKPVLIPDVSADSSVANIFRQTTGLQNSQIQHIRSYMGIPLIAKEQVIGILALHHGKPFIYTEQQANLVMAFANHVAVAISNARLHEQAQRLAALQERQRLARELHDSVSQALYGIALGSRTAKKLLDQSQLGDEAKASLSEPVDYILSLSEGGLAEMRALIFELRPESLESEGLVAALAKQATALQARHRIEMKTLLGHEPDVALATKEVLYRVGQEALNNVVKHAEAKKITVSLDMVDDNLVLEITDDGKGFDVNGNFTGHLGLCSMRERLEQIGGTLIIKSSPCHGTQITAVVPLD